MSVEVVNPSLGGISVLSGTKDEILDTTPTEVSIAYATDVKKFLIYDGSSWNIAALRMATETANPDRGYTQSSDKLGYGEAEITDKRLYNIVLQGSSREENGSIRIDTTQEPDTFEIYLRGSWQTIIYDLTTETGDFRHTPLDKDVYVWRGDSIDIGLNSQPIIQEYKVSRGAYPVFRNLSGGTF